MNQTPAFELPRLPEHGHRRRGGVMHVVLVVFSILAAVSIYGMREADVLDISNNLMVALLAGVLMVPLLFIDPLHGLLAYALLAPISPEVEFAGQTLRLQDPLSAVILLGTLLSFVRRHDNPPPLILRKTLVTYALYAVATTALAYVLQPSRLPASNALFYTLKTIQYVVLALCVAVNVRTRREMGLLLAAMLVGAAIQVFQLVFHIEFTATKTRLAGQGFSEQANVLGMYLVLSTGILLGVVDRTRNLLLQIALVLGIGVVCLALLETKSRSGYASLGVMAVVALFLMRNKLIPLTMILGGGIAVMLRPDFFQRMESIGATVGLAYDSSYEARIDAYGAVWRRITGHVYSLWFGQGRGIKPLGYADSQWGIELLYGGMVGFALIIAFIGSVMFYAGRTWYRGRHSGGVMSSATLGCFLALIAATVSTFGLTSWSSIRCAESIFLIIGLVMACDRLWRVEWADGGRSDQLERMSRERTRREFELQQGYAGQDEQTDSRRFGPGA